MSSHLESRPPVVNTYFSYENRTAMAEAKREYDLRKAENQKEISTQKAISDLARSLQGT